MKKHIIVITLLALLLTAAAGMTQVPNHGTVSGTVIDEDSGKPIENVLVKYHYTGSDKAEMGTMTDAKGEFTAKMIEPNQIVIFLFSKKEYQQEYRELVVEKFESKELSISLKKITPSLNYAPEARTFQIKYRDAQDILEIIKPFLSDATGHDKVSMSPSLQTITVYANQEKLAKIAKTIATYDVPPKQIWVEVMLVKASGNGGGKAKIPAELNNLAKQLESVFKFTTFEIIGRTTATGVEGANIQTSSNMDKVNLLPSFQIRGGLNLSGDVIRLDHFQVQVVRPIRSEIATTVNIPDGGKMILGASNDNALEGSLITVVSARVMK